MFGLPFTPRGHAYYAAALPGDVKDLSFGFRDEAGWCAIAACNTARADVLTWYEFPIEVWLRSSLPANQLRKLSRDLIGTLKQRAKAEGATSIRLRESHDAAFNGILSALLLEMGLIAEPSYAVMLDLALDDDILMAGMRSGHRQQVRAGSKMMSLIHVDQATPDKEKFDCFRELHAAVAGRVTRPRASWDRMFDLVETGEGDLALTYWNGELLGGTLMLDAGPVAYYASGAYVRSHFDKPLAHYPLFECVSRARVRGRTHAHLGEVIPPALMDSEKERSINSFKLGFSSSVTPTRIWTIPVAS